MLIQKNKYRITNTNPQLHALLFCSCTWALSRDDIPAYINMYSFVVVHEGLPLHFLCLTTVRYLLWGAGGKFDALEDVVPLDETCSYLL